MTTESIDRIVRDPSQPHGVPSGCEYSCDGAHEIPRTTKILWLRALDDAQICRECDDLDGSQVTARIAVRFDAPSSFINGDEWGLCDDCSANLSELEPGAILARETSDIWNREQLEEALASLCE